MINLSRSFLKEARKEAEQAATALIENADRIETSLRSRVGDVSKEKRMTEFCIPIMLIGITTSLVVGACNLPIIMDPVIGKIIYFLAGILTVVYLVLQIAKLKLSDSFYKEAFAGLEQIRNIKNAVEKYRQDMRNREEILESSVRYDGNGGPINHGMNYQAELDRIEYRASELQETKNQSYDRFITMAYYGAAFSVAAAEAIVLQPALVNLLNQHMGNGYTIYMICAVISVIGGPLLVTYYLHTCRGIAFSTISYLWIMLAGLFGLLLCGFVIAVIVIAIEIIKFVIQLVLYVAGLAIGLFILYSICSGA